MTLRASPDPAGPGHGPAPARTGEHRNRSRAARAPLPLPVLALGALGACVILLPFVGLGTRVAWTELPTLLASRSATRALGLSLRTCLVATAVSVSLGVPLALLLARQWPGVRVGRVLAVLPMTMPPVVAGIALLATLGRRGLLGGALEVLGVQIPFTTAAVVIAQVFVSMPYLVVTLEAALRSRDTRAETIARTLGAGPWRILTRVTLPLAAPALVRGTALALGRSLGEFGATIAFAGSKEGVTRTMPLAIYLERESDTAVSLALATLLIVLSLLVVGATNVRWSALTGDRRPDRGAAPAVKEARGARETGKTGGTGESACDESTAPAELTHEGGGLGRELRVSFRLSARDVAVDLSVRAGRTMALVGPNGSGKSTVCAVVAGLLDAEEGRVVLGERVLDGPESFVPAGRREAALLGQDPGVFTHMSVLSNVAFALRCQGANRSAARSRARSELAAVGAAHLASRSGGALSGGQAARVALARALVTAPRLLLLDEPMSALDVTARREMRALIARRTAERGITTLLVTHDVLDITALADVVVVLEGGRVAERGTAADVLAEPVSDFAAGLTGTAVLTGRLDGDALAPALSLPGGGAIHGRPRDGGDGDGGRMSTAEDGTTGREAHGEPDPGAPGIALVPPDAVALYRRPPRGSPRNVLAGRVVGVERAGALVSVEVRLACGQAVRAAVTAGAVADMGINVGQELWCAIKAVAVRILPRRGPGGRAPAGRTGAD